jgi:hypothetical protein
MAACSACGATFTCGLRETAGPCWCAAQPLLAEIDPALDCLCPACLDARLAAGRIPASSAAAEPAGAGQPPAPSSAHA